MILHLERKFTSPTETFIANQINFQTKYKSIIFTAKHLNSLQVKGEVYESLGSGSPKVNVLNKKQVEEFLKIYKEKKPFLIHGHFLTDAAFFNQFSRHVNIHKVCSGYGYDVSNFPKRFFGLGKFYFRTIFKEYTKFIAMSNDMADDIIKLGCPSNKIIVHYHGINTDFFEIDRVYEEKKELNILTIASLVSKKGHITVLKALAQVKVKHPAVKIKYRIVGAGSLLQSLKAFINEKGLNDSVEFLGLVKHGPELLEIIKSADVFVHPSRIDENGGKEGIPGTIVEAMASGLPVISTYHAGIPDIITNHSNGLLVKENDHLGIADMLQELYVDKNLRRDLGTNAKKVAIQKLDIKIKTKELLSIYDSLLN